MKSFINIDQKSIVENNLHEELDIVDLMIFDAIRTLFRVDKNTITKNKVQYHEVTFRLISDISTLIPVLINESAFYLIIKKLEDCKLIVRSDKNKDESISLFTKGDKWGIIEGE